MRRALRIVGIGAAAVVLLAAVAVLTPAVREAALRSAFRRAGASLPGKLEAASITWPKLDRVELRGLRWTADADTLATADRISVTVRLVSLFRRELDVERLDVEGLAVDVPAGRAAFPSGEGSEPGRPGVLPSLAVQELHLDALVVTDAGQPPVRVSAAGGLELREGRVPSLRLAEIEIRDDARGFALGPGALEIDPVAGVGRGEVPGHWGDDWTFTLRARTDEPDRFTVELAIDGPDSGLVRVEGDLEREGDDVRAIRLNADLRLPAVGRLAALPGAGALRPLPAAERLAAHAEGTWTLAEATGRFAVRGERFAPWDSLRADVEVFPAGWAVSGLRLSAPGLAAEGSWRSEDGRHRGDVRADISDTRWMTPFVPPDARPDSLRVSFTASASGTPADLRGTVRAEGRVVHGGVRVDSAKVALDGGLTGGDLAFEAEGLTSGVWIAVAGTLTEREPWRAALSAVRVTTRRGAVGGARSGRVEHDRATGWKAEGIRVESDFGELRLSARADTAGGWSTTARFRVPVPDSLAPGAKLDPIEGEIRAQGRGGEATARIDAASTPWLEEARAELRSGAGGSFLDSLAVRGLGASVHGGARVTGADSLTGELRVDLSGVEGLRRFAPAIPDSVAIEAAADVVLSGTAKAPSATVRLSASGHGEGWDVPAVLGEIDVRDGAVSSARVRAADTSRVGGLAFHRLAVQARPMAAGAPFPLFVSAEAAADSGTATFVGTLEPGDSAVARVDTLAVTWGARDLRSQRPFAVRWDAAERAWSVRALELRGTLGSVLADGGAGPDSATFRTEIVLVDPPRPPGVTEASWPRPAGIEAAARLVARDSLTVRASVRRMTFGTLGELDLHLTAGAGSGGITSELSLEQGEATPLTASVRVPRRIDATTRTAEAIAGRWSARVDVTDLPVPVRPSELADVRRLPGADFATTARVSGTADIQERDGSLAGSADLEMAFPDLPRLRKDRVALTAGLSSPGSDGPPGLSGRVRWLREGVPTAEVDVALPNASGTASPFTVGAGDEIHAEATLKSWRLDDLDALLPPGTRLEGALSSSLRADGAPDDPNLDGWFEARDVVLSTARGDRARAKGRLEFAGRAKAAEVEGRLEVTQALFLVPEPPRVLHNAQGDALLWERDSTSAPDAAPPAAAPVEALDLGIDVSIPGSCWIRGRGLDVEMAGDLSLVLSRGQPRVDGQLRAVRGTFSFLGNRFDVERGVATFYGTEAVDPDLDLVLSRRKGTVKAIVHVTGRTSAPVIELSSEPPLEEADIISHLLFGRASGDLDREQTGLLQSQASAALQMFAIPGLERQLGARLGLDVVQVRQRDDASEQFSVVVGKYLSPRALLKYDQGLDRSDDFSIDLEYWLTRHLRLETTTSRQNQSGVLLNWSVDY